MASAVTALPAVRRLWGQDVREEHLCQLAEVEELLPAAAESHVQVGAVLLQSGLLEILCALHCRGSDQSDGSCSRFAKRNKITGCEPSPFCLALLMISMCFMETLRSFCVMRDATST